MFAEVIINSNARALNRIFDYKIPEQLASCVKVGSRVFVPFGKGAKIEDGFVVTIKEKSEYANKDICKIDERREFDRREYEACKTYG